MPKYFLILAAAAISLWPAFARADEATRAVQEELRRRHLFYGNIDGRETPGLTAALKRYQERKGFRQTGVADPETLRSMGLSEDATPGRDLPDVPVLRSDRGVPASQQGADTAPPEATTHFGVPALPSQMEVSTYLRQYLDACQGGNVADELAFYAPQVAYFDRGVVTKTYIRNESVAYRQHWPERTYTLGETVEVAAKGDKLQATYRLNFWIANSALNQKASGSTQNTVLLTRGSDQQWEIAGIQEERVRAAPVVTSAAATKRRSRSHARSQDATGQALHKVGRTLRKIFR